MNRRSFLKYSNFAVLGLGFPPAAFTSDGAKSAPPAGSSPNSILLKDYRPRSIYKIPVSKVEKAKYPIIDMHSHPYAKTPAEITTWLKNMDAVNIEKTMILTMATGKEFDEIHAKYSVHPDRFELWCGFDFSAFNTPAFEP